MGVGGQDGFIVLAKEIRRAQRAQEARLERRRQQVAERRERMFEHEDELSGPIEGLGCPRCLASYGFGDNCPRCGDELVSASLVGAEREPVRRSLRLASFPVLALFLSIAIVFGSVAAVMLMGH